MTSPSLDFRPYGPEDLPALQRIRQAAFAPVFRSFAQVVGEEIAVLAFARADEEQARLLDALCGAAGPDRPVLVAVLGGAVVGFVCFSTEADGRVGEIGLNAVHPDHAGRGIGTEMVRRVLARLKAHGAALATVSTGGDPGHAPARRAYEKAGFGAALPSVSLYRLLCPPRAARRSPQVNPRPFRRPSAPLRTPAAVASSGVPPAGSRDPIRDGALQRM